MKAQFKRTNTFSDKKGHVGTEKQPRIDDLIDLLKLKPGKWMNLRLVGPVFSYGMHWIEIETKEGKLTKLGKQCLAYSDEIESKDSTIDCPYCELDGYINTHYYTNVIVRDLEDDKPAKIRVSSEEKQTGFKDKDSESWTPVRVLRLPAGAAAKLHSLSELNKHGAKGAKKSYPLSDERYGRDLLVMWDKDAAPANQYNFQLGEPSELDEDYLLYNIEDMITPESYDKAEKEAERLSERMVGGDDEEDEDDDEDYAPSKSKKSAPAKKGGKKPVDEDEDEDDDEEEEPPAKSKKSAPAKKSKKPVDEDDEDDFDEDEEDEPPAKSKKAPAKKSKVDDEDDEDDFDEDDEDDFDEDDEEDEPPAKKSAKKSKKPVNDDDDDDDDDEPPVKSKKPVKKSKVVDDDDDDDDDFDEDDDDEPPVKSKKAPAKKSKKPVDDDDEDDDDDDFED